MPRGSFEEQMGWVREGVPEKDYMTLGKGPIHIKGIPIRRKANVTKFVRRNINAAWRAAVRAFVLEASKKIKVKSGMSMASLLSLAGVAGGGARTTVEGKASSGKAMRGITKGQVWGGYENNVGPFRSRALGERLGKDAYEVNFLSGRSSTVRFQFEIKVLQYAIHETKSQWNTIARGKKAFIRTFEKEMKERFSEEAIFNLFVGGRFI
jgi:hypothetical protein